MPCSPAVPRVHPHRVPTGDVGAGSVALHALGALSDAQGEPSPYTWLGLIADSHHAVLPHVTPHEDTGGGTPR